MFRIILAAAVVVCYGQTVPDVDQICTDKNSYMSYKGSCDTYIECRELIPTKKSCPDGLHYKANAQWPEFPCGNPNDVSCIDRAPNLPVNSTAECPRQFGLFPAPDSNHTQCGRYRMCAEGRAFVMHCPFGLAFNPNTARCDWPEMVPSCNVDEFLGFKCPSEARNNSLITNYEVKEDCTYFFSCVNGKARVLSCDVGFAFDAVAGRCVNANLVNCSNSKTNVKDDASSY